MFSMLALPDEAAPGSIPSIAKKISEEQIINQAEDFQLQWLEESRQCLVNVDQTHLELASCKPVLQKLPLSNFVGLDMVAQRSDI